jgi:hypothetical protein
MLSIKNGESMKGNLIEAIYPYRYRWDIASTMIQKADCDEAERIKAMEWLKKFHKDLKVENIKQS